MVDQVVRIVRVVDQFENRKSGRPGGKKREDSRPSHENGEDGRAGHGNRRMMVV